MNNLDRRWFIKTAVAAGAFAARGAVGLPRPNPEQREDDTVTAPGSIPRVAKPSALPFAVAGGRAAQGGDFNQNLIKAPQDPSEWPAFRTRLARWREETKERLHYDDHLYRRTDFAWVPADYSCCFLMLLDETFYDHRRGRFTPEAFLAEGIQEFGGYDSVVLWHAYPRIGVDDRNQFDFYRDQPGGFPGLRQLVETFHARGVKVFIDYNPWDQGTHREEECDLDALASLVNSISADGIFLDTLSKGAAEFRAKLDAVRPGVVLESEEAPPLENVQDHHMSWAQWFWDGYVPGVLRNKWLERRHMQHQIKRWDRDHTGELHTAWMNGSGMMVWENVFGSWVGWTPRDRGILRAMLPIQRRYRALFSGEGWVPLVDTQAPDVFASLWESGDLRLWTLINRSERRVDGQLLIVPHLQGTDYFDLIEGRPAKADIANDEAHLFGVIPPRGIGALISGTRDSLGMDFSAFLDNQRKRQVRADFRPGFPARKAVLRPLTPTKKYAPSRIPAGMVEIPPVTLNMAVTFRIRECGFYEPQTDIDLGYPNLHHPLVLERQVSVGRFAMDLTPVTNAQYAQFLQGSKFRPRYSENFLRHWRNGAPPSGLEDHPVVYVDLNDARAYAQWAGKRLPAEEEWQYAAQGPDLLRYPWGQEMKPGCCNSGESGGTTSVTAFPQGRSPFGCYDMCGNTWEWTESERSDGRTRFCILRGGSFYQAQGSEWYTDGGPRPANFALKFLLMWPGLDRCATIGFRCCADLAER